MQPPLQKITSKHARTLLESEPLSGGDINAVYLLKCKEGTFVAKLNNANKFPNMFAAEAKGLELLATSSSFEIPKVLATGELNAHAYILMEHIHSVDKQRCFWRLFAENLATLHATTQENFGLDHHNYIGSLPQLNNFEKTSASFYWNQRLKPQFDLAHENGFKFDKLDSLFQRIYSAIPNEVPSLIHGDLWNGNYLVSENGMPVLIDPAVSFAPRELDLAMMQLFGGFPKEVFTTYNEIFPLEEEWEHRIPLFQLYYVLVHLNLFGRGYLPQANSIINSFT
jgi:fructosamine-3-kinase